MYSANPSAPSIDYLSEAPDLQYLLDVYGGSWLRRDDSGKIPASDLARSFLPQDTNEDDDQYRNRLNRTPYDDRFAQSVRTAIDLILQNGVSDRDMHPEVATHLSNIGSDSSSLPELIRQLGLSALRDGRVYVLVDYPPADPSIVTLADLQSAGRRPYWVTYQALDLINWRVGYANGRAYLEKAVLRELRIVDGLDGEELRNFYRVLSWPNLWLVYEERVEMVQEGGREVEKTSYYLVDQGTFSVPYLPLICVYGGMREGFFKSRPPLKAIADLNIAHYQSVSDHRLKMHLCSNPVPVLRDSLRGDEETLDLSPYSYVWVRDPGGAFSWQEPLATSLIESRSDIAKLEQVMDMLSSDFLMSPSDRQSATSSLFQAVGVESSLFATAADLEAGINQCLKVHGDYLGINSPGKIALNPNIVKVRGRDSQMMAMMVNAAASDLISKEAFLTWAIANEYLPDSINVAEEIQRIGEAIRVKFGAGGAKTPE